MTGFPEDLEVLDWGTLPYLEAHERQQQLVAERLAGNAPDRLIFCEHPEVVTLGRKTPKQDWTRLGLPVVEVERGGEATWHGPGQTVAYPILLLPEGRRDLHRYLRDLEQVVIDALATLGVESGRKQGWTGVWVKDKKLCSIGIAVRRWVTWHGLALNVDCDLDSFGRFAPCGLNASVMGRVSDFASVPVGDPGLRTSLTAAMRSGFGGLSAGRG